MSYELTGKLIAKYDTVQRTETFKTREFAIEKTDDIGGKTIVNYAKGAATLDKAPHINFSSLAAKGFTQDELEKIENEV